MVVSIGLWSGWIEHFDHSVIFLSFSYIDHSILIQFDIPFQVVCIKKGSKQVHDSMRQYFTQRYTKTLIPEHTRSCPVCPGDIVDVV